MNAKISLVAAAISLGLAACSGCSSGGGQPAGEAPLSPPWAGKTNPLPADIATVERGRALFLKNCSMCHGENADGKAPSSPGLNPPPANFRDGVRLSSHSDAYLFMRVATGKSGTAMPAFAEVLGEDDRWAILRYLRSLPGATMSTHAATTNAP